MGVGMYVVSRPGTKMLYARIIVPPDLSLAVGRKELWKSLKTADKREAQKRSASVFAGWLAHFEALRTRRPATVDDNQKASFDHYLSRLALDVEMRARLPQAKELASSCMPEDVEAYMRDPDVSEHEKALVKTIMKDGFLAFLSDAFSHGRGKVAEAAAMGDVTSVRRAAEEFTRVEQLDIVEGSPAFFALCNAMQRGELEAFKRSLERNGGEWGGTPTDPIVRPPRASQKAIIAKPGETILDLFAVFKREKHASKSDDTWNMNEKIVQLFVSFIGERAHVTAITRTAIRDWKVALDSWPIKAADVAEFRGLSFKETIRKNGTLARPKPRISDRTKNKYLSALGSFCTWLLVNEHIPSDVMKGMSIAEAKSRKRIVPYRQEQLRAIFGSPLFVGFAHDGREHLPGTLFVRDWRYWLPYLALYSGARLGELCQLMTADVRQIGKTWVMHITTEGGGDKRTKTGGSQRVVPIHPALISIGFLDWHATVKELRLFPDLERDQRGHFGGPSRFFGRYFKRIGVKSDATQNFHSFRHGIADAFRRAGFRDEEFAPLLGHVKATTTARYGTLREGELSVLKRIVYAAEFPGLESGLAA